MNISALNRVRNLWVTEITVAYRFLKSLTETSDYFKKDWPELECLHINLGPDWKQQEIHQLFRTHYFEDPSNAGWERPPGLGTCALATISTLCHIMHNWMKEGEQNAVVRLCQLQLVSVLCTGE